MDFGVYGKLSYSSVNRCNTETGPWLDGDFIRDDSDNIHVAILPRYRCVGGDQLLLATGAVSTDANDYFKYENQFGPIGLQVYYDDGLDYGKFSGDDALAVNNPSGPERPAQSEIVLSYGGSVGFVEVSFNDLGDFHFLGIKPLPSDFSIIAMYSQMDADVSDNKLYDIGLFWAPKNLGFFKGGMLIHEADKNNGITILRADFGNELIDASFALDDQSDFASEVSYHLSDNASILFGYDNGFDTGDGVDERISVAAPAPGRGSSWELGIQFTF